MFQSPSLRGSGRSPAGWHAVNTNSWCFNPLHCGAVVARDSGAGSGARAARFQSPSLRGSGRSFMDPTKRTHLDRFNPLHCGAVVARRSGSTDWRVLMCRFNPLHCGAVVAPPGGARCGVRCAAPFQSPSLRGSGRSSVRCRGAGSAPSGFNPLHCGAVVARACALRSPGGPGSGFNPLHCGAVVARPIPPHGGGARRTVSIPFIAGQWSLQRRNACTKNLNPFQSPSLRGSGRSFILLMPINVLRYVSIPFIAGQWSLRGGQGERKWTCSSFQSPSLRGSGRSRSPRPELTPPGGRFNPLHCGAVVAPASL